MIINTFSLQIKIFHYVKKFPKISIFQNSEKYSGKITGADVFIKKFEFKEFQRKFNEHHQFLMLKALNLVKLSEL